MLFFVFIALFSFAASAQKSVTKKETFKVFGECGMCKKTIEKAAKDSGAIAASWSEETKQLTVTYKTGKSSNEKIQQAIAVAGYDTRDLTADNAAYDKLHECCKYERKDAVKSADKEEKKQTSHH